MVNNFKGKNIIYFPGIIGYHYLKVARLLKLIGLMDQPSPYKTYLSKTVPMLENLTRYYKQTDGQTKRENSWLHLF